MPSRLRSIDRPEDSRAHWRSLSPEHRVSADGEARGGRKERWAGEEEGANVCIQRGACRTRGAGRGGGADCARAPECIHHS